MPLVATAAMEWELVKKGWKMDPQMMMNLATSQVARLVMKLGALAGVASTTLSQDKATAVASAIVTLAAFGIELIQSHYAHGITAAKATAAAANTTAPSPTPT